MPTDAPDPRHTRAELLAPFVRDDVVAFDAGAFDRLLQTPQAFAFFDDSEDDGDEPEPFELIDGVAVLKIRGGISQRGGCFWFWSWVGYDTISASLSRALDDSRVRAVLLAIDSPGGVVAGCFDAVRAMRAAVDAAKKPVVAYADEHCYSAAYAIACVADEIVVPQTGGVGSVGVITSITSVARMYADMGIDVKVIASGAEKADGHPALPLSPEATARAAARVAQYAEVFTAWVSERRGMKPAAVAALQAGIRLGDAAPASGLADRVATYAATLDELVARVAEKTPEPRPLSGLLTATTTTPRPSMSLLALLGVATEADAIVAVQSLITLRTKVRAETGADTDDAALGTLAAWKRDAASLGDLRAELAKEREAAAAIERKQLLAAAVASMRLTPAEAEADGQPEAFVTGMSNAALRAFAARPAPPSSTPRQPAKLPASAASLTEEQRAIADQLGIDPAAYAAQLAAQG